MSIVGDKKKIFGKISAFRILNEAFPTISLTNSLPSLNNDTSSLDFLIDLLKTLIGFEEMKGEVVNVITYQLRDIEVEIKKTIKQELKSIVSHGVDPTIPSFIRGDGVNVRVDKIDFLNILKVNPISEEGKLLYDEPASKLVSPDFNTYLYYTIQDGAPQSWGDQSPLFTNDILDIKFDSDNNTDTNVLNISTSAYYGDGANGKTLTDLNNDYIDSIQLFGSEKMLINIIDGIFGSLASAFKKSQKQLEEEEKLNNILECIINSEDDVELDDSFFTFSNSESQTIEETARNRKKGIKILKNCENVVSSVPVSTLTDFQDNMASVSDDVQKKEIISQAIDDMAEISAQNDRDDKNKFTIKLNFIELLIRRLMLSIANFIISPKIIIILLLNYKIIYGVGEEYGDGADFLKKNKTLIRGVVNKIRDTIIQILLKKALKEIGTLVATSAIQSNIEKSKNELTQLLSTVGVPSNVIRMILNLA